LLEASDELGGRARRLPLELAGHWHVLDNGQHLLLGAYGETAALFAQLNVALDTAIERRPSVTTSERLRSGQGWGGSRSE